ncbi:hypothetical protein ACLBW8_05485 [Pseudomonas sp. M5A4_2d]
MKFYKAPLALFAALVVGSAAAHVTLEFGRTITTAVFEAEKK